MFKKIVLALVLVAFAGVKANAAESPLQQIADALDVSTTKTFQFTANGKMWGVGQATSPMAANPRAYIRSLTRVYDFTAGAMRDELVRTQGEAPPSGGDYQPIEGEQRMISLVSGDLAWNESGKDMIPATQDAKVGSHPG